MIVLVFVALVLVAHLYLWHRMVRSTTGPGRARKALTWGLVGLVLLVVVTFAGTRMELGSWLAWPGYLWVALMFYLVVFLVVLEVPRAVASVLIRRSERRRAVAKEPVPVLAGAAAPPAVEPVAAPPMS
ncbi:MAG: metallophosphoesterase, partial [Nonomuraea sp.]|nr:metallophosphoesterase [Nonomuraea sp.]